MANQYCTFRLGGHLFGSVQQLPADCASAVRFGHENGFGRGDDLAAKVQHRRNQHGAKADQFIADEHTQGVQQAGVNHAGIAVAVR